MVLTVTSSDAETEDFLGPQNLASKDLHGPQALRRTLDL